MRIHKRISAKALGVSFAASVLLDAVIPFGIATVFELLARGASLGEFVVPLVYVVASSFVICFAVPYRQRTRRKLQSLGHDGLSEKLNAIVAASPTLSATAKRGEVLGAMKEFFETWERFLFAIVDYFVPFVTSILGLLVILSIRAPIVLLPVVVALLATFWLARKVGNTMGTTWKDYKDRENEEFSLLADLVSGSQMLWLVRILTRIRRKATTKRGSAMDEYVTAMVKYNLAMFGLHSGLRVAAISGGVFLVTQFGVSIGVVTLLLMYALTLGERLHAIFNMNEVFTSSVVDADMLVRRLEASEPLGPELRDAKAVVRFKDVVVELGRKKDGMPETVLHLPDLWFTPGISMLGGRSGRGKTTTLRILNGCQKYTRGSVTIDGNEVAEFDVRGSAFYGQQAYDRLSETVCELFGGEETDVQAREQALKCAGYVDAPLDREVGQFSGGELRRLCMALLFYQVIRRDRTQAGILSLDEPTNDLDNDCASLLLDGIKWLASDDPELVIVIVTHDDRVKGIADFVIEM